eukprot:TRINITY_DN6820_c0_g1_i1.p1 TRINITY_DN6820_c0_g1~~TRINITY_DN6820_c0_g1_i1.p1  ORF type:complete len:433 (+),score=117.81 TRINITY_DN6820_c0_g1_i1:271-1569(+)
MIQSLTLVLVGVCIILATGSVPLVHALPQLQQHNHDDGSHRATTSDMHSEKAKRVFLSPGHSNNWAVLVSTSRYWYNYRHSANVLSMYRTVTRLGIPDSNIILMLADDHACNSRNIYPGTVYNNANLTSTQAIDLYGGQGGRIEVDYRGYDVSVENFLRVLLGRHDESTPRSRRLQSDANSNILIYMTGHGGEGFLKFQDKEQLTTFDLADAFEQMRAMNRYHELFYIIETCHANTMYSSLYSANILAMASSLEDEHSVSHHHDLALGTTVIDRVTFYLLEYLESLEPDSDASIYDMYDSIDAKKCISHPHMREDLFKSRPVDSVRVVDFFGGSKDVVLKTTEPSNLLLRAKHPAALPSQQQQQEKKEEKEQQQQLWQQQQQQRRKQQRSQEHDRELYELQHAAVPRSSTDRMLFLAVGGVFAAAVVVASVL